MSQVLEQVGAAIAEVAGRLGPSVAGLGRGWGRGSGVVVAPEVVLTAAHVLRGDDVAVRIGGADEAAHGRVAGVDADLDLAVVRVDTGGASPSRGIQRRSTGSASAPRSSPWPIRADAASASRPGS
jgi:S1-C subfamily serine protease